MGWSTNSLISSPAMAFFLRENDEILDEARSIGIFRSKKLGDRMRFNGISLSMQN
jgi:hypothetical protein